jgi:hypothetical protein
MCREDGGVAHQAGYFELINKSEFVCCIRVFQAESEPLREASLPTYTTRKCRVIEYHYCFLINILIFFSSSRWSVIHKL